MDQRGGLLGAEYRDLYAGYYCGDAGGKRELSAVRSVEQLKDALNGLTIQKVIDVGAGEGSVLSQISRWRLAQELYAVEISGSAVDKIKSKDIPLLQSIELFDGYRIPYLDKAFDLATVIHVLEHVEHERLFLREVSRVARRIYVEVPLEFGLRVGRAVSDGRKHGHINFYVRDTFRSLLESCGLAVVRCETFACSRQYDVFLSGQLRGFLKNGIRRASLRFAPNVAPWVLGYNCYALCEAT
ncbi:MAG: class I SAM-dependent methyltransferase [Candidatus Micrarchaeaceae archaeon]